MTTPSTVSPPRSRGRALLWLGLLSTIAGPFVYFAQIGTGKLTTPWYVPALAVFGTALVLWSLLLRGTIWRVLGLLFCAAMAALIGWFLQASTLPPYEGPLATGQSFPEFNANLANGAPFTHASLQNDKSTVLVFFRGHW